MSYTIAPSILSANWARLGEEVSNVLVAGADMIHIDVMDNHYVPNLTCGPKICHDLRRDGIEAHLDVHLMVEPVDALIESFARAGANAITFHPEAARHVDRSLQQIRELGCQAGLALNPATPLTALDYVTDKLDLVLVMSVNPGFGGQQFIPQALPKIRQLVAYREQHQAEFRIAVDGGINSKTIVDVAKAGAECFIAGSAIFGATDYSAAIQALRTQLPS